jgi:hypothetical protein
MRRPIQQVVARADLPAHHLEEWLAGAEGVAVEHDLFRRRQ